MRPTWWRSMGPKWSAMSRRFARVEDYANDKVAMT